MIQTFVLFSLLLSIHSTESFAPAKPTIFTQSSRPLAKNNDPIAGAAAAAAGATSPLPPLRWTRTDATPSASAKHMVGGGSDGRDPSSSSPYSREIRLREEAESPFRKVRFFLYAAILGGAFTSLAVSTARIAAGLSGINVDLLEQSLVNAGVDLAGIVLVGTLFKRDVDAQESRLKRAAKGAELAKLAVRGSSTLLGGRGRSEGGSSSSSSSSLSESRQPSARSSVMVPLSSLRSGRGIDKRVVIAAAGKDKIQSVLQDAMELSESLMLNDLVVVPVIYPQGTAPIGVDDDLLSQDCVALPAGGNWRAVIADEATEAINQGVDIENEGFCVVLKKNGRVGQRTRGIFLDRMVGEVTKRREAGMDVSNI